MEGFDNEFKRGTHPEGNGRNGHAWVKVDIDGKPFLADPEQNRLGNYDSVFKFNKYQD